MSFIYNLHQVNIKGIKHTIITAKIPYRNHLIPKHKFTYCWDLRLHSRVNQQMSFLIQIWLSLKLQLAKLFVWRLPKRLIQSIKKSNPKTIPLISEHKRIALTPWDVLGNGSWPQCEHMTRFFVHYLAIYNNENLDNTIKICQWVFCPSTLKNGKCCFVYFC